MKQFVLLLCVLTVSSLAYAQQASHLNSMKEGIVMKNGKMWYVKALTGPMTLDNGVTVSTDGTMQTTTHKTSKLAQGKCVDFEGKVGSFHGMDCKRGIIEMDNNTVWVWSMLEKPFRLHNGSYAMPDGTLKLTTGKYQPLKEKDFIDFDGNMATVSL